MPEPTKVMRIDLNEEEVNYIIRSINMGSASMSGDIRDQIECNVTLRRFLYDPSEPDRLNRLNAFRVRIAKLALGEEVVAQTLKDIESEALAKGWTKCPDCGGYHG